MKNKEIIAWQNLQISALNTVAEDYSKYIRKLWKENAELKTLIENMQRDVLSLIKDRMNDDVDQNIIERLADKWGLKEND